MQPPIVLVDMDGVLANFEAGTFYHLRKNHPDILIPSLTQFRVHMNFDDETIRNEIRFIHNQGGFFRNLPLMNGALEGWQSLINLGYHPRICSSPLSTNPWCEGDKRAWLSEHFGAEVASDAIIDRNKYLYDGIALIDDRTDLLHTDKAPWQQILFDAPYNQSFETEFRLRGWADNVALAELLERVAGLAARQ